MHEQISGGAVWEGVTGSPAQVSTNIGIAAAPIIINNPLQGAINIRRVSAIPVSEPVTGNFTITGGILDEANSGTGNIISRNGSLNISANDIVNMSIVDTTCAEYLLAESKHRICDMLANQIYNRVAESIKLINDDNLKISIEISFKQVIRRM